MARYISTYKITGNINEAYAYIQQYLLNEGYEFVNFEGDDVFKKGHGIATGPTIFKFTMSGGFIKMETWMKYAVLPGVYAGEIGTTGVMGWAVKGPWKERIEYIEGIMSRYGVAHGIAQDYSESEINQSQNGGVHHSADYGCGRCSKCNSPLVPGSEFCVNCGTRVANGETCKSCGAPLAAGAQFCMKCGHKKTAEQNTLHYCPSCGAKLVDGASFCQGCGRKL